MLPSLIQNLDSVSRKLVVCCRHLNDPLDPFPFRVAAE